MIACCEVDDADNCFYSRAILIRYRGERHVSLFPLIYWCQYVITDNIS